MGRVRIGLSGWSYASWRGSFYPPDLPRGGELAYAARRFETLEINASFYGRPRPHVWERWAQATPRGFVFAVKGNRYITHQKKLRDPESALARFLAGGVLDLGRKLGPLLWQLPEQLQYDPERVETFLAHLPNNVAQARELASACSRRGGGASACDPAADATGRRRLRHAVEVRHESYFCDAFLRQLRRHRVALVVSDAADWPRLDEVTAGFVYVRLHGSRRTYVSRYDRRELRQWAQRIRAWAAGDQAPDARRTGTLPPLRHKRRDVYVYFDNDAEGHAPRNALELRRLLAGS